MHCFFRISLLDKVFFIWETKKWSLVTLDRMSSYTVTIVWEFAWAYIQHGWSWTNDRLTEVVVLTGLTALSW